jgi:CheY-like chemotaxis protein
MITMRGADARYERPSARPGARRPIFVVDDDSASLRLLGDLAEEAGWEPSSFTTLGQVREALDESRPDVMVLDDDLPDGRGGDLARELRSDPATRDIHVVVCTAADVRRRTEISAFVPVIAKPFDVGELERLITPPPDAAPG